MAEQILQLNFKFSIPKAEYEQIASSLAGTFADLAGLRWKVWLLNEEANEAGGIYLFEDEASVKAFLDGPLAASVSSHPAFSEMSIKQFAVIADATATTRGPV